MWSIIRWVLTMLINLLGFLTAPIIFPILYPFRNTWVRETKPFWFYFDDECEFGFDVEWWTARDNFKPNFWWAYKWAALRNPAWNLQASLAIHENDQNYKDRHDIVSARGQLTKDEITLHPTNTAVLKYVDKNGNYMDNKGEFLSIKHSILGSMFLWFEYNNKLYWRYSKASKFIGNLWIEIQIGITHRYTFRMKFKKVKIYKN